MHSESPISIHDRVEEYFLRGNFFVDHASPFSISFPNPSKVHPRSGYDLSQG
jgi:hypothetical protein